MAKVDLTELIKPYLEPNEGVVGLTPNPETGSCDNGLLFSSIFMMLLKAYQPERVHEWVPWYGKIISERTLLNGVYCRKTAEVWPSHWDDHIGVAMASLALRTGHRHDILAHGRQYMGFWGKEFLWRIPLFYIMCQFCSRESLTWLERQILRIVFAFNLFEPKAETSGKVILFLAYLCLRGFYQDVDQTLSVWMTKQHENYGDDYLAGPFLIYYGSEHPFSVFMKSLFSRPA